ncbi:hydrolase [Bordetella pertussis]|nr:hydrolase [Bordetella pertussis]
MPWITRAAPIACLLALAGCAARGPAGLDLDTSITAVSQSSRVRAVVLHYTSTGNENSLKILSERKVSAHYLITDTPRPRVYRLVDETRAAWHASISAWYDQSTMNSTSIGIELVNPGWTNGEGNWTRGGHGDTDSRHWAPYSDAQIETLIVLLRDIVARHGIAPENIVGHSDIAPQRKVDPGPCFHGSGWRRRAWAAGTTKPARPPTWPACRPRACRTLPGSRANWPAWDTPRRNPACSIRPPATCWPRSRCTIGQRATTASPTPRPPPSCWRCASCEDSIGCMHGSSGRAP